MIYGYSIIVGLIAIYAIWVRNKHYNEFLQRRYKNDFLVKNSQTMPPVFYTAFYSHYHHKNQIVFENEKLLNDFLIEYNRVFWGKNTGLDFILAENIDTCNYMETEKRYNGMTFVGNSENAIPQGYEFVGVYIFRYDLQK